MLERFRQSGEPPMETMTAQEARAADLIVTSPEAGTFLERLDEHHLGPLVLKAGRPVLIVRRLPGP